MGVSRSERCPQRNISKRKMGKKNENIKRTIPPATTIVQPRHRPL
jgi:hypothetical protein